VFELGGEPVEDGIEAPWFCRRALDLDEIGQEGQHVAAVCFHLCEEASGRRIGHGGHRFHPA
jgi:hypothetical protein